MMILTPAEIYQKALAFFDFQDNGYVNHNTAKMKAQFMSVMGSDAVTLAALWSDLQTTSIAPAKIQNATEKDLTNYLATHHWLKCYPTFMAMAISFRFLGVRKIISDKIWDMLLRIAHLKEEKIKWPEDFSLEDSVINQYTVDGKHMCVYEQTHAILIKDKDWYSHKSSGPGVAYNVAMHIWESKIIHVSEGIRKASVHDKTIYMEEGGLMSKTRPGANGLGDNGFRQKKKDLEKGEAKLPMNFSSSHNTPKVRKFEARAKTRQETLYGRVNVFACMNKWRHDVDKHCIAFNAILVILQYQFDNGHPLFDV